MHPIPKLALLTAFILPQFVLSRGFAYNPVAANSATSIRTITRVEAGSVGANQTELVRDLRGQKILVRLQDSATQPLATSLAALDESGRELANVTLQRPSAAEYVALRDATVDTRGDLRAVVSIGQHIGIDDRVLTVNLSKSIVTPLSDGGRFTSLESRLIVNGRSLAAVTVDVSQGPDDPKTTTLLKIVDEDSGQIVQQKTLNFGGSARLGQNAKGELKVLLFGYEVFDVLDVATNQLKELFPVRQQPSSYPGEVNLKIGRVVILENETQVRLLDRQALFEGRIKVLRSYAPRTTFIPAEEGQPVDLAVQPSNDGITISEVASGRSLGVKLPKTGGPARRIWISVGAVVRASDRWIAVTSEPKNPSSYIQGTILTYFDMKTGQVLRVSENRDFQIRPTLRLLPDGTVIAVEQSTPLVGPPLTDVIDLASNSQISHIVEQLVGPILATAHAPLLGVHVGSGELCLVNLLDPRDRPCVKDPRLTDAAIYGYKPFEVEGSRVIVPLTLENKNYTYPEVGYLEVEAN